MAHITVRFGFVARLIVSVEAIPIAWDVVDIAVFLINEHYHPAVGLRLARGMYARHDCYDVHNCPYTSVDLKCERVMKNDAIVV